LERRKGIYDLLSTMPRILAALPAATLTVAGTGPEQDGLRDAASRLGVANAVDFVGQVAVPAVPALLSSSSLLCLPSHGEPFGMVLLEAMAAGRTVVATRVGGPASIVVDGAGGALVEPGDVSQLAAALIALLSSRARLDSAGEFNRARAESHYSLDSVVDRIERIYESVA
jgi:glycogen(starch) synthase